MRPKLDVVDNFSAITTTALRVCANSKQTRKPACTYDFLTCGLMLCCGVCFRSDSVLANCVFYCVTVYVANGVPSLCLRCSVPVRLRLDHVHGH